MGHLPEIFEGIPEFEKFAYTEDEEFKFIEECNAQDLVDTFVLTADEAGITVWEREIGIRANRSTETLDFRRKRIINRYTMKPPFTIKWLDAQLYTFLGDGFIKTERDDDVEILYVYADLDSWPTLREFDATIEMVLPLSMQYAKILRGYRDMRGQAWAAATNPMRIRFAVDPA